MANWSLKSKLMILTTALCGLSVAVGIMGYLTMKSTTEKYQYISQKTLPKITLVSDMFIQYRGARLYLKTLQSNGLKPQEGLDALKAVEEFKTQFQKAMNDYSKLGFEPEQQELFEKVSHAWSDFDRVSSVATDLYRTGNPQDYQEMVRLMQNEFPKVTKTFVADIKSLIALHNKIADKKVSEAESLETRGTLISILVITSGTLLGLFFGVVFLNRLISALGQISQSLKAEADSVDSTSLEISHASKEISAAATEQSAALHQTVTAVHQINAMVSKNAENAANSQTAGAENKTAAINGKQIVSSMIRSMEEIDHSTAKIAAQTEASNKEISEIVNMIREINAKTKVINDIVFQTKLLSFNASVEAARAGEHGKGFAVVAEEIGNLAQMSGSAAKEITALLESSTKNVEIIIRDSKTKVIDLVSGSKTRVEKGLSTAQECGRLLDQIVTNSSNLVEKIGEIAAATKEQSIGVQEISSAMSQLDSVTQKNVGAASVAAASCGTLAEGASNLRSIVQTLVDQVAGQGRSALEMHDSPEPDLGTDPSLRRVA